MSLLVVVLYLINLSENALRKFKELLTRNLETFMWVSPIPHTLLDRYDLVQKECSEKQKIYKDLLIYKNGYKLSKLDRQFITELCESKRKYL